MNMNDHALNRFGSARLAKKSDYKRAKKKKWISAKYGVYLVRDPYKKGPVCIARDQHILFFGGPGSGKTSTVLQPIVLGMGGDRSIVCNDPKGEICASALPLLHQRSVKGYALNPFGLHTGAPWFLPRHRFNPWQLLDADSPYFTADVAMYMEAAIKTPPNTRDSYFYDKAKIWAKYFTILLKTTLPDASWIDFYDLLKMMVADFDAFRRLAASVFLPHPIEEVGATAQEIIDMHDNAPREFTSIQSTLTKSFDWLSDPAIRETLKTSDFHPSELIDGKTHVYLILPAEHQNKYASFQRSIIASIMNYKQRAEAGGRILFIIDEAGQLGYFQEMERGFSYGRGFGIQIIAAFQNTGQAEQYVGGASGLMASAGARVFVGVRDLKTAQMVSNMMGVETLEYDDFKHQEEAALHLFENKMSIMNGNYDVLTSAAKARLHARNSTRKNKIQRLLMTPDEVMNLLDHEIILLTSEMELPPAIAHKMPYYRMPELAGRYMPSPYHPPFDRIKVKGRFFLRTRKVVSERVPERFADWPQFQQGYWSRLV
jgi:type IV secretion system protein VirD4